jgi:hypothetical protein
MKRVYNSPMGNDLWFDGINYWRGQPGSLVGPFTESELHDVAQQENLTGEDSSIISLDKTTIYSVNLKS